MKATQRQVQLLAAAEGRAATGSDSQRFPYTFRSTRGTLCLRGADEMSYRDVTRLISEARARKAVSRG